MSEHVNSNLARYLAALNANPKDFKSPYEAGRDCGLQGPTSKNSDFRWFHSRAWTTEWEHGKRDGEVARAAGKEER